MRETNHLFVDLQPPPNGLRRLQDTLAGQPEPTRWPGLRITAGAVALTLSAIVWLLPGAVVRHRQTAELTAALRAATAVPDNGIQVTAGAAIELPSGHARLQLYLLQSLPTGR